MYSIKVVTNWIP